jgi:TRAP-type C4-dicarboxylate transport system permease small subunit
MNKLIRTLNKGLSIFCISLCSTLVACVVWQVFARYVLDSPSTTTDEIARFLFIWVGLMGAAYTLGQKRHLAIELLEQKLETKPRQLAWLRIIINLISLVFASVILTYGGMRLVLRTLEMGQISPALGLQMGWVYLAIPLAGVFMLMYLIADFVDNYYLLFKPHTSSLNPSSVK